MPMTVQVHIDGKLVLARSANRLAGRPGAMCLYVTDDGKAIEHHYDDGAAALAIKMLANIRNTLKPAHKRKIAQFKNKWENDND